MMTVKKFRRIRRENIEFQKFKVLREQSSFDDNALKDQIMLLVKNKVADENALKTGNFDL